MAYTKALIINKDSDIVKDKAIKLAANLLKLSQAENYDNPKYSKYVFPVIHHPTLNYAAMIYDDRDILIRLKDADGNYSSKAVGAISQLANILGFTYQQAKNYCENNDSFKLDQILSASPLLPHPDAFTKTFEEMDVDGWFIDDII